MKDITEEQLIKAFKSLKVEPSPEWLFQTKNSLSVLANQDPDSTLPNKFSFHNLMTSSSKLMTSVVIAIAAIFLIGGGVAWAADGSKPGEALHPVDLAFEQLRRTLIGDDVAKADFEMDVLEERIGELKALESEGADSGQIKAALDEVGEQQEKVHERVRTMEENNENDTGEKNRIWQRYEGQIDDHMEYMWQYQEQKQTNMEEDVEESLDTTLQGYEDSLEEGTQDGYLRQGDGEPNESEEGEGVQQRPRDQDQSQTNRPEESGTGNGN